jgi:formylglycine-generating enzyme required for sulfatase activity
MIATLKLKLALAAASLAISLAAPVLITPRPDGRGSQVAVPQLVELRPGSFAHRAAGDFSRGGKPANAPIVTVRIDRPISIMKVQVTAADYQRCVDDGACASVEDDAEVNYPAVNVSWRDAVGYADWLSHKTGVRFRLPTDEEWAYAAGTRFHDEGWPDFETDDPAQRWVARYEAESERSVPKALQPIGSFGVNENGLLDVAGNVWEWTSTCFRRVALGAGTEKPTVRTENCGVRVVEGQHRTYVTDFIRDGRAGGCAVGTPPANLGFRLIRDEGATRRWWLPNTFSMMYSWFAESGANALK